MPNNIDILNDQEFNKMPKATRDGVLYKLHEILLESSMSGGMCEHLIEQRDAVDPSNPPPVSIDRYALLVMRTNDALFPENLRTKDSPPYHRELFRLDEPPEWITAIPAVKQRIQQTFGQLPKSTWLLPKKEGDAESQREERLADLWGITYMDGAAVLHAIDLDVQLDFQHERAQPKK